MSIPVEIIGDPANAAPFISWAKQQIELRIGLWYEHVGYHLVEFTNLPSKRLIRFIGFIKTGFVMHPRTSAAVHAQTVEDMGGFSVEGGWVYVKGEPVQIVSDLIYPMVDSDNASMLLDGDASVQSIEPLPSGGSYGNIYWHNNDVENLSAISYKGTPTRHFSLPNLDSVNGADNAFNGYGVAIYKSGELLAYSKDNKPIFGAAEIEGDLVCCTSEGVSVLRFGDWIDIPIADYSVRGLWFFDSSGTKAITSDGSKLLTIIKNGNEFYGGVSTYYEQDDQSLLEFSSESTDGRSLYHYNSDSTFETFFELASDATVKSLGISLLLSCSTEYISSSSVVYKDVVIYDTPRDYTVVLSGPDNQQIICASLVTSTGLPAAYSGECGSLRYSFSGNATQIGDTNCAVLENNGCSSEDTILTISATITGPGISATGSLDVAVSASPGYWSAADSCTLTYVDRSVRASSVPCTDTPGGTFIGSYSGPCSVISEIDGSAFRCASYITSLPESVTGETVIAGGIKRVYIKQSSTQVDIDNLPTICYCSYQSGALYANIENEVISVDRFAYYTRNESPCADSYLVAGGSYCPPGDCNGFTSTASTCRTGTRTTRTGTNTRAGYLSYHWICL